MHLQRLLVMLWLISALNVPAGLTFASSPLQFGMHTIRAGDDALRLTAQAGFSWVIQLLEWREVAPTPDRRNWEYPDLLVQGCSYYGLNLALRLDHPPDWAIEEGTGVPVNPDDYAAFVREVVCRYRERVQAYIVWNEPNLALEWNDEPPNPEGYVRLLKAAHSAVKQYDPQAKVIAAGLAPTNARDGHAMDDRLYLQALYDSGFRGHYDALGAHPYGFAYPPTDPPGAHDGLNFSRLAELREIMVANGDAETPIWATEVGWTTAPVTPAKLWQKVSAEQQAEHLVGAFRFAMDNWPWLELMAVWNLAPGAQTSETDGYNIAGDGALQRPAYEALARLPKPPQIAPDGTRSPVWPVQILAPDVVVHLSDTSHINPHWSPLHCDEPPCRRWAGGFYVREVPARPVTLRLEEVQVEEVGNMVRINGRPLQPVAIPLRAKPNFATAWTTADMIVPTGALKPGYNTIELHASPRLIPYQAGVRFESMQIRNVRLLPP